MHGDKYSDSLQCLLGEEFRTTDMELKNQHTEQGQQDKVLHIRSNKKCYSTKNRKFWGKGWGWTIESKQSSFPQCPLWYHQSLIGRLLTSQAGNVRECSKRKTSDVSVVSSGSHKAAALRQNPGCKQAWKIEQGKCLHFHHEDCRLHVHVLCEAMQNVSAILFSPHS